jgi:hypothetical protein
MRTIGWSSCALATASIACVGWIVLGSAAARAQLFALEFPLDGLGENIVTMVVPLFLSSLAVALAVVSIGWRSGRWGLGVATASWAVNLAVLGRAGLKYLF